MSLSSFASRSVEDVVAANPQTLMQLYWCGTREDMVTRMDRAKAAGVVGAILTLDWSFSDGRDWGSPSIPERIDLKTMLRHAPDALRHPRWLLDFAKAKQLPDLTTPNMALPGQDAPTFFGAYFEWMETPPPSWEDVAWLVKEWDGPIMLKGIIRVDDAQNAVDAGVTAISVSNHGGNNLDCTPASIRALPAIAKAVGDDIEVVLDGGIRRGSDVVKAVAFGAKAVMIGRAGLWGLAANGQAGVENVLDLLRGEIDSALLALGLSSVEELSPDHLVIPPDFRVGARDPLKLAPSAAHMAAVHWNHRAGDHLGIVGREEENSIGDVTALNPPLLSRHVVSGREVLECVLGVHVHLLREAQNHARPLTLARAYGRGTDCVDVDVELCELHCP